MRPWARDFCQNPGVLLPLLGSLLTVSLVRQPVGAPTLVAQDLDRLRIGQLQPHTRRQLDLMVDQIARARQDQLTAYRENGPHVRVVAIEGASHYLFVDHARDVADEMLRWLGLPPL